MRSNTQGNHQYRLDQMRRLMQRTDETTRAGAFDVSTEFTLEMLDNLDRALDHPDMTTKLASLLSTVGVELKLRREAEMQVNE